MSICAEHTQPWRALRAIAADHFTIEPGLQLIAVYAHACSQAYLLVEVRADAIPTSRVEPFYCAPGPHFAWPLYIADVTEAVWAQLVQHTMAVPDGWRPEPLHIFHRQEEME